MNSDCKYLMYITKRSLKNFLEEYYKGELNTDAVSVKLKRVFWGCDSYEAVVTAKTPSNGYLFFDELDEYHIQQILANNISGRITNIETIKNKNSQEALEYLVLSIEKEDELVHKLGD